MFLSESEAALQTYLSLSEFPLIKMKLYEFRQAFTLQKTISAKFWYLKTQTRSESWKVGLLKTYTEN